VTPLTWLYVPGDRPDRFAKALASEADVVIVDLEDAVVAGRKDEARENARRLLAAPTDKPVVVRINDLGSPWAGADLAMVARAPALAGVRIPKVERADDVRAVRSGLGERIVPLHCLIESARGLEAAFAIATSDPAVATIALGEADLRSDLALNDEDGLHWARGRIVVAARAAGLPPPAMSVYPNVEDLAGLAATCRRGRALGFLGRAAIHPRQLATIVDAFVPTELEVKAANQLLNALSAAAQRASGVAVLADGTFVDRAMVEQAERVVALAARR
jgi:citrate lyase subunit beta / citryl-CoA lyase